MCLHSKQLSLGRETMDEKQLTLGGIVVKTAVVHTLTYFVAGILAFNLFDYSARFAEYPLNALMRPTDELLVRAGLLFQPIRGVLFGLVFYLLREVLFKQKNGWLVMWINLVVIGILSTFAAAMGSIEGLVYSKLSILWGGQLEVLLQSLMLSLLTWYWVRNPQKRWLSWSLGILCALALLLTTFGVLAHLAGLPGA